MILDRQLLLSNAQPITVTAVSSNSIDLASARDIGIGDNIELFIRVIAPFAGGTSVQFAYVTSANADLSAANVIVQTPPILTASLAAGSEWLRIEVPILSQAATMQRYIGVSYTVAGTFTGGTVTAGLALDREASVAYPSGLNTAGF